jgi:hypothetical protein
MTALAALGILGLTGGVLALLIFQAQGCDVTVLNSILDLLSMNCPF